MTKGWMIYACSNNRHGTAGVSVLRELVKHPKFNQLDIDLYDDKVNMGQGVPFQNDSSELLINMPSKKMSLNLDDETEFWKWYKQQTDFNFDEPAYLPRFVFGHYMKSYLSMFTKNIQIYQLFIIKFKRFIQILILMKRI